MTDFLHALRHAVLGAGLILLLGLATAQTGGGARLVRNGDYIVAVVNSELVTAFEVEQRLSGVRADAQRSTARAPTDEALRQQVLDALIDERVIITYARDSAAKVDEVELDRAVNTVATQNKLSIDELRERLRTEGNDFLRFRNNLRDQILVERVREREVVGRIRVSDGDIDKWIDKQRAAVVGEVQLNLAQVLIAVAEGASASEVQARQQSADAALARLRSGENFAAVALEMSADGNRERGGEIGLRPANRLPDLFVEATLNMAVGQIIATPLRSGAGFHILKVLERRERDAFAITQTRARHILLRPSERVNVAALGQRLGELGAAIEAGQRKFDEVAKEVSEDGSAPAGGDLGWVSPGGFVPEFEEAMNALPVNGLSAPVTTRFGVHLIQVLERRDVTLEPKDVREQARNVLREQKFEQAFADWVKELRQRAYLELREPPL